MDGSTSACRDWSPIPTTYYASYASLVPKFGTWKYAKSADKRTVDRDLESTPGQVGARASKLYELLDKGHYDVKLSKEEMYRITVWLDSYSPFYGVYEPVAGQALGLNSCESSYPEIKL